MERMESGQCSSVEQQIEHSKRHWSQLSKPNSKKSLKFFAILRACLGKKGPGEIENVEVIKTLQSHPTWGSFFHTFGYDLGNGCRSSGELKLGKKFAEGGQAELFHANVTWSDPVLNESILQMGGEYVLKVFKKGTSLQLLQSQWPQGMLQFHTEKLEMWNSTPHIFEEMTRSASDVVGGTLLKDGRFAFLLAREDEDLRSCIDRHLMLIPMGDSGPFSKQEAKNIMYHVAKGMDWLHSRNIVHRDLKASIVLIGKSSIKGIRSCYVADFECSVGVIGTGFFRAPEILQACKDRNVSLRFELFTKEADVYSYGMTCYEILTGKLPFEGHPLNDYDLVLNGQRPRVPEYVDDWVHELLSRCWQSNPKDRPTFGEILNLLLANSVELREVVEEFDRIWREEKRSNRIERLETQSL